MNSITYTFTRSSCKIVQVMINDKKWKNIFKHILCRETWTHDLNVDSYTLYPKG